MTHLDVKKWNRNSSSGQPELEFYPTGTGVPVEPELEFCPVQMYWR
jgi:hypothetical protein